MSGMRGQCVHHRCACPVADSCSLLVPARSPSPPACEWDTHNRALGLHTGDRSPPLGPRAPALPGWDVVGDREEGPGRAVTRGAEREVEHEGRGLESTLSPRVPTTAARGPGVSEKAPGAAAGSLPLEGRRPPTWHFLGGAVSLSLHASPRTRASPSRPRRRDSRTPAAP